ncbi:MAG: type III pantothenate kinase [Deltaproteobacteria bacterium]|nr:type III pantothenate kinase [Deltaproteobacteria bacterium]
MLLVLDVGNTNIVMGMAQGEEVRHHWRLTTCPRTTDEFGLILVQHLGLQGLGPKDVHGAAISCVVPSLLYGLEKAIRRYLEVDALVIGRGTRTGMRVHTDNPREVGADRIVNAVAARERYGAPVVIVDFGTATTFDCVDAEGDYVGGAIAPGFQISAEALYARTAKLPRIELERARAAIGTNTVASMQSGLYWGYVGLVDGIARRCKAELGGDSACVATGGLANMVASDSEEIDRVDDFLTLDGLRLLWERNRP